MVNNTAEMAKLTDSITSLTAAVTALQMANATTNETLSSLSETTNILVQQGILMQTAQKQIIGEVGLKKSDLIGNFTAVFGTQYPMFPSAEGFRNMTNEDIQAL